MNAHEVLLQSRAAYAQWAPQWRAHAKEHTKYPMKPLADFQNSGVGRAALLIANGYSLEENLQTVVENQGNVDIFCVDKALAHLVKAGVKVKGCLVMDANVPTAKYLEPIKDQLSEIILFANVCANPKWAELGNWKDRYFIVNRDVCQYEKEFQALSGCPNLQPAGTNVSNGLVILLSQSEGSGPGNFFGYDKVLLLGFDYCWDDDGYYAFDRTGGGKTHYMRMIYTRDLRGELVYTSGNLMNSCRWMDLYIRGAGMNIFQTSRRSLLQARGVRDLKEQMAYLYRPEDSQEVVNLLQYRRDLEEAIKRTTDRVFAIGRDHYKHMMRTT